MKQLTCDMCGGTDLIKQDGMFICQTCGTKYSVEEAKKMMIEGLVDVSGSTVKIDDEDKIDNLYQLARRAKNSNNYELASKYYNEIVMSYPNDWEANLYVLYNQTLNIKMIEIEQMTQTVLDSEGGLYELVNENIKSPEEKKKALTEITTRIISMAELLFGGIKKRADNHDVSIRHESVYSTSRNIIEIAYRAGEKLELYFGDEYSDLIEKCYKKGVELHYNYVFETGKPLTKMLYKKDYDDIKIHCDVIKKYDHAYQMKDIVIFEEHSFSNGGCYIATAVYGSYDCPEVWTLRRFRDYYLAKTWYGRAFIRTYYIISPILVKWFGHTKWFKRMWKGKLDRMIKTLQAKDYKSTPYEDREWK